MPRSLCSWFNTICLTSLVLLKKQHSCSPMMKAAPHEVAPWAYQACRHLYYYLWRGPSAESPEFVYALLYNLQHEKYHLAGFTLSFPWKTCNYFPQATLQAAKLIKGYICWRWRTMLSRHQSVHLVSMQIVSNIFLF